MSSRARRAAAKRVNYAKQQDFSDEDVFEDSDEEPQQKRQSASRRPRKSKSADPNVPQLLPTMMDDDEDGFIASRPVYTEKGYDTSLPPLRERFPFLPEYEDDGSPKIDLIVGRRLVDEKEGEGDEQPNHVSEDDENGDGTEAGAEAADGRRTRRGRAAATVSASPESKDKPKNNQNEAGPAEYEYLVKYKGRSYLHLEWKSGADLESMNKSAKGIYRRYLKKLSTTTEEDLESPDFDPSYIVPERIIDEADQEITIELTDKELLRWEKQREKELAAEASDADEDPDEKLETKEETNKGEDRAAKEDSEETNGKHDPSGASSCFVIITFSSTSQ